MYWFLDFEQERVKFEVPADAFTERKGKEEEGKIEILANGTKKGEKKEPLFSPWWQSGALVKVSVINLRLRQRSGHVDHPTL